MILAVEIGDSESERCRITKKKIVVGSSSYGYVVQWVVKRIV